MEGVYIKTDRILFGREIVELFKAHRHIGVQFIYN